MLTSDTQKTKNQSEISDSKQIASKSDLKKKEKSPLISNVEIINSIERTFLKQNLPLLKIGDNVKVGVKIIEGNKERVQFYEGTIIAKKNTSINTRITVRKTLQGIGVERIFLVHSPKVDSIIILRSAKVRRSKLYYLRNLKGKASRLKQTF